MTIDEQSLTIDKDLVAKKLDFLNEQVKKIENMEFDERSFVENPDTHDLVVFRLQQAVETCIDISTHIIAQTNAPRKEAAKDAFLYLGEQNIIGMDLAQKMGKAADFRNRVVHGYNDFDFHLLYQDYKENLDDLKEFGSDILKFLDSSN